MTDLYATLGLEGREHSTQAIKRAWKSLSSKYHPDREGGDAEKMADVNKAYETLSDPERRKHYDATQELNLPRSFDVRVQDEAMAVITFVLSQGAMDPLEAAKQAIQLKLNEITAATQNLRQKLHQLKQQREGIKTTREKNLFHMVIDQQLAGCQKKIAENIEIDKLVTEVFKLLQDYQRDPTEMQVLFHWKPATDTHTGTS